MAIPRRKTFGDIGQPKPPAIEVNQIDVLRFDVVLDNGIALTYDLNKEDSIERMKDVFVIVQKDKKRTTTISRLRVLYTQEYPAKVNKISEPLHD